MENDSIYILVEIIKQKYLPENNNSLSTTNWIAIVSVFVLIVGWFTNGYLRRREDISREKLKYRMETINYCIDFINFIEKSKNPTNQKEYFEKLNNAKRHLFYFGTQKEYSTFLTLEKALHDQKDIEKIRLKLKELLKKSIDKSLKIK